MFQVEKSVFADCMERNNYVLKVAFNTCSLKVFEGVGDFDRSIYTDCIIFDVCSIRRNNVFGYSHAASLFLEKEKAPTNKKNSLKLLIIKSYIVTFIFNLICWSGLIAQYIDEMQGIYR